MYSQLICSAVLVIFAVTGSALAQESLYDLSVTSIDGEKATLAPYRGKVALVVNVASRCGFTPQYAGLEKLYRTYGPRGFVILGFPSNDFGEQEPGSDTEIKKFCGNTYGVTFPLFAKGPILGASKQPVYKFLTSATGGTDVQWNFEKFLVDASGKVVERFPSSVAPDNASLVEAVEKQLALKKG